MEVKGRIRLSKNNATDANGLAIPPLLSDLDYGQVAVNFSKDDPCLFFKKNGEAGDEIVKIVTEEKIAQTLSEILGGAAADLDTLKELLDKFTGSDNDVLNLITTIQTEVAKKADKTTLSNHTLSTSNPHAVTKGQVGLGNVLDKEQLGKNEKAADSDKLDGLDSTDFARNANYGDGVDLNGVSISGTARLLTGVINSPKTPARTNGDNLISLYWDGNAQKQLYFDHASNDIFYRRKSGTWGEWQTLYHSGNANNTTTDWTANLLKVTSTTGGRRILIGNQDSNGVNNPSIIQGANGTTYIGTGNTWNGDGGTFTSNLQIGSNGNVRIGSSMSAPSQKLEVDGNIFLTSGGTKFFRIGSSTESGVAGNNLIISAGSAKAGTANTSGGSLILEAGVGTGGGSSDIVFNTATGTNDTTTLNGYYTRMFIRADGRIGIGTTSPETKLHVAGDIKAHGFIQSLYGAGKGFRILSSDGRSSSMIEQLDTRTVFTHNEDETDANKGHGCFDFLINSPKTPESSSIRKNRFIIRDKDNYLFNILDDGNVGLGTGNPLSRLHVIGTVRANSFFGTSIRIECDNNGVQSGRSSEINNYNTHLYLQHNTANHVVMCGGGGNVGIGNGRPSHKLDVDGNIGAGNLFLRNGNINDISQIWGTTGDVNHVLTLGKANINEVNWVEVGGIWRFKHDASGATTGVTFNKGAIESRGSISSGGSITATGEVIAYKAATAAQEGTPSGSLGIVYDGLDSTEPDVALSANQGRVLNENVTAVRSLATEAATTATWSNIAGCPSEFPASAHNHYDNTYVSDRRLKSNIETIENGLEHCLSMNPVQYDWTQEALDRFGFASTKAYGMIAQEMELLLPHVTKKIDDHTLSIDYIQTIPFIISAIKQLHALIKDANINNNTKTRAANRAYAEEKTNAQVIADLRAEIEELKNMVYAK